MFIELNPGKDERLYGRTLVGKSGELMRKKIFSFNNKTTWLATNIIMCFSYNSKELGTDKQIKTIAKNCNSFIKQIIKKFPAKIYVPLGKFAIEYFGITGSVVQNSGKIVKTKNEKMILPVIHPSAILRDQNHSNLPVFNNAWDVIYQLANKFNSNQKAQISTTQQTIPVMKNSSNKFNVPDDKLITEIDDTLTYFDSINLNGSQILNVYIDKNGEKKYKIGLFEIPIYIKACDDVNRTMLNDNFEYVTYINGKNKFKLSKIIKDNLIKHKLKAIS